MLNNIHFIIHYTEHILNMTDVDDSTVLIQYYALQYVGVSYVQSSLCAVMMMEYLTNVT